MPNIPLHDLVVGAYPNRFYIRSLQLGKEVVVCQSHMLNPSYAPNVCRFLLEVASSAYPTPTLFYWGAASDAPFLPRLVRGKIVLSPAQWNINTSTIILDDSSNSDTQWFIGLQHWREQWHVPRYVYLVNTDMRLLLDLEHPLTVADLHAELNKIIGPGFIRLQEMLPDFHSLWLRDDKEASYIAELVIPLSFAKDSFSHKATSQIIEKQDNKGKIQMHSKHIIRETEKRQLPGGEWTFLKLYAAMNVHDEIIAHSLRIFARKMNEQELVDRWFFIRYTDPEPHLRIRFHAANPQFKEEMLRVSLAWSQELIERGLIYRVCVDTYYQEIERYGGPKVIEMLESVFTADSIVVSDLIASLYTKRITLEPFAVAVFSLDQLFANWGLDHVERLHYIQNHTKKYQGGEVFRKQQKLLCELILPWDPDYDPQVKIQREQIGRMLTVQENLLKRASKQIQTYATDGELWQSEEYILQSLAHMHLNRLLGINREQEQSIYGCWRQTLESVLRRPDYKERKKRLDETVI